MAKKSIISQCTEANKRYNDLLYTSYATENKNKDGTTTLLDIHRYSIPFPQKKENDLILANPSLNNTQQLKNFYKYIGSGVNQDYKVSKYLEEKGIRSTVRYMSASKETNTEQSNLYFVTNHLTPISTIGIQPEITVGFVIDMARRIFAICCDLDKIGVTHRNINPHCIFVDEKKHIWLGGFDCAAVGDDQETRLLHPTVFNYHVAPDVKMGARGGLVSDMYSIASIMNCYFAGENICNEYDGSLPLLLPDDIVRAIDLGMSMKEENTDKFKKALNQIYKNGKNLYWNIPIHKMYQRALNPAAEIEEPTDSFVIYGSKRKTENESQKRDIQKPTFENKRDDISKKSKFSGSEEDNLKYSGESDKEDKRDKGNKRTNLDQKEKKTKQAKTTTSKAEKEEKSENKEKRKRIKAVKKDLIGSILSFAVGVVFMAIVVIIALFVTGII